MSAETLLQPGRRHWPLWAGPLVALIVLAAGTVALEWMRYGHSSFLQPQNLINIPYQWSFVGIIAVGMTLAMTLGGIDLSVGSLAALVGGVGLWVMNTIIGAQGMLDAAAQARTIGIAPDDGVVRLVLAQGAVALHLAGHEGWGMTIGIVVMLATGTLAGLLNGWLIARWRVAPLIVTLGGLAAFRSLALSLADGGEFRSMSATAFGVLGQKGIPFPGGLMLPYPVVVFVVVAGLGYVLLQRTRFGRHVIAIGCNERAAVYSAIPVARVQMLTYTLLGLLTAVSGWLVASRMNSVSSGQTGLNYELDAIAAVVIGGTRMRGGSGTIAGTVVGVLMLGVIGNMLNMLDAPIYLQGLVKGVIIVGAVLIQRPAKKG